MNKTILPCILLSTLLLTSCANGIETVAPPAFITATLHSPNTPLPALTQMPSLSPPLETVVVNQQPVEGVTTTQLNLRSEPSTAGETLGTVAAFSTIQITGKEAHGAWYQILDPAGTGWIIASYVQVTGTGEIPLIDLGPSGLIIQGVNVRNGPGRDNASLGTLVANDVVSLTGKDSSGDWLQINFKGSPGWIAFEFTEVTNVESLPVTADQSAGIVTQQTPDGSDGPSITIQDHDSLETPITSVTLHPSGARGLQSNGSVSFSTGDVADWIQFTTFGTTVAIEVRCAAAENLQLDLYENELILNEDFVKCNELKTLNTAAGQTYTLKLGTNAETLNPVQYSVLIKTVR